MEGFPPLFLPPAGESLPDGRIGRQGVEAFQERPDVHPGPACHERNPPARTDAADRLPGFGHEPSGAVPLVRIRHVHQVMGNLRAFRRGGLRRPDVHPAVDLHGVGAHDLEGEEAREGDRESRFPGRRGT
jgi:hypothetical protein